MLTRWDVKQATLGSVELRHLCLRLGFVEVLCTLELGRLYLRFGALALYTPFVLAQFVTKKKEANLRWNLRLSRDDDHAEVLLPGLFEQQERT